MRTEIINGVEIEMTPEREAAFLEEIANAGQLQMAARIEWGSLIRALTEEEIAAFDGAVQAAPPRFRWLVHKTSYISTDDPDYPVLKAAFDGAFGKERSDVLLPPLSS